MSLQVDPKCVKALYRRGLATLQQGDLDGAKGDLQDAARRDPRNRMIRQTLDELKQKLSERFEEQKLIWTSLLQDKPVFDEAADSKARQQRRGR